MGLSFWCRTVNEIFVIKLYVLPIYVFTDLFIVSWLCTFPLWFYCFCIVFYSSGPRESTFLFHRGPQSSVWTRKSIKCQTVSTSLNRTGVLDHCSWDKDHYPPHVCRGPCSTRKVTNFESIHHWSLYTVTPSLVTVYSVPFPNST